MKAFRTRLFIALLIALSPVRSFFVGTGIASDLEERIEGLFSQRDSIPTGFFKRPENLNLLSELKNRASNGSSMSQIVLLKAGDPEAFSRSLGKLRSSDPLNRNSAQDELATAANADLITQLAPELLRNESPEWKLSGDLVVVPESVVAAEIIKSTVLHSPVFNEEVKAWAKKLPRKGGDARDAVQRWWVINEGALKRKDYRAVSPGPSLPEVPPVRRRVITPEPVNSRSPTPLQSMSIAPVQTKPAHPEVRRVWFVVVSFVAAGLALIWALRRRKR